MDYGLRENDPYRRMNTGYDEIRPEISGSGDNVGDKKNEARGAAAKELGHGERVAGEAGLKKVEDGLDGVRENEEGARGLYSGTGKSEKRMSRKHYIAAVFKKKGPVAAIIMAFLVFGGFSFAGISTELVAWKENIYSMFGQSSAVINRRSNFMMRKLLKTNRDSTSTSIFGNAKFKINAKLADKFKAEGIDYIEGTDADGKKLKVLVFEDVDGKVIPIVADDADLPRLKNANLGIELDADSGMTLANAKSRNRNFSLRYDKATVTFTGKIAGWFDDVTDSMYERIIGKEARSQTDIDDPDEEKVNKMLLGNASEGVDNDDTENITGKTETETDGGEETTESKMLVVEEDTGGRPVEMSVEEIEKSNGKIPTDSPDNKAVEASLSNKARKAAMTGVGLGCAFLKGVGAISMAIGAVQTMNVINYASKYLEMADKIKVGDADETVNIALNNLNTQTTVEMYSIDGEKVEVEGAVTQSDGWNQPFSSVNIVDENDPSALLMNRELTTKNALMNATNGNAGLANVASAIAGFGSGITAFRSCNAIQGVVGTISFAADVAGLVSMGVTKFIKDFIVGAVKGAALAGAMIGIGVVLQMVTPVIARWFGGMLTSVFLGKNGGFALLSGAQNVMNSNLQMSTGRYATNENAIEVFALTHEVESEWAEYERATKSPFDLTSKYTFFGGIYNSVLPIVNTAKNSVAGLTSSVVKLTKDSALALVSPTVSAVEEVDKFANSLATEGNCGFLQAVGVAGDFACNKYAGAYVKELTTEDPEEVYKRMAGYGSFEGENTDGNPKVKMNSDYAKYLVACVASDTQPGTVSGIVQGFIGEATNTGNTVADGLINYGRNFIPGEGLVDALEATEIEANLDWNTGLACTGNTEDKILNEKVKTYSMYNLDQRVLHDMGIIETNSTVAFLEEYYEKYPLDNSFEGKIARFSGMSKEEVEDTLALIEYYQFLDEYEPEERYAFGEPAVEMGDELKFDNENVLAGAFVLLNQISYSDVRNRSFAV